MSSDLDAELADALRGLDDIDDLVDVALSQHDDSKLGQYLNSGADLRGMLSEQDKELRNLQEVFIEEHCQQAESLCVLYTELSECENKLSAFEEQIFTFQKSLTDTAEDIVRMQQQTVELVHRVANRKHVSNRISEVYNALKECEEFCDNITNRDVDDGYLTQIRELESKIAFLANNKELENSPVDLEIRPKLRVAAQRAGEKLQRYLSKKMVALSEEGTNIGLQQQALVKVGQYAFSFLARYNTQVASELHATYQRTMSDVYFRLSRDLLREFCEYLPHACGTAGPLISNPVIQAVRNNKDCGAVGGAFFQPPPSIAPPGSVRDMKRSVSVRVEERIADLLRSKSEARGGGGSGSHMAGAGSSHGAQNRPRREADLHDLVDSVRCADFSYAVVILDPATAMDLDRTTCWLWRFVKTLSAVVNMVLGESGFISKFFFAHGQDLEDEEQLARHVLARALDLVMGEFQVSLPHIRDRLSCAAALRVVERVKTFLCQNANPIPLLLLSALLEVSTNSLRRTLHQIVASDTELLQTIGALQLQPFPSPGAADAATQSVLELLKTAPKLGAALGPHDITRQFALTSGALHLFNTMPLPFSRVDGSSVRADETVNQHLRSQLTTVIQIIDTLAKRHSRSALQSAFRLHNLAHLLLMWRSMANHFDLNGQQQQRQQSTSSASDERQPQSPLTEAEIGSGPHVAPASQIREIETQLRNEIVRYIADDGRHFGVYAMMRLVEEAEAYLGSAFFATSSLSSSAPSTISTQQQAPTTTTVDGTTSAAAVSTAPVASLPPIAALPASLQEATFLQTITQFSRTWKDDLRLIADSCRTVFGLSADLQRARSVTPDAADIEASTSTEFLREVGSLVLREYFHSILDANSRVHAVAEAYYGTQSAIQAKLVGNLALLHEVQGHLEA